MHKNSRVLHRHVRRRRRSESLPTRVLRNSTHTQEAVGGGRDKERVEGGGISCATSTTEFDTLARSVV